MEIQFLRKQSSGFFFTDKNYTQRRQLCLLQSKQASKKALTQFWKLANNGIQTISFFRNLFHRYKNSANKQKYVDTDRIRRIYLPYFITIKWL